MVGSGHNAVEAAKTVLEVADVAWAALERCQHQQHHGKRTNCEQGLRDQGQEDQDLEAVRSENRRLRGLLEQNLTILQSLAQSPSLSVDCPPDLYARLKDTADSKSFLSQLERLHQATVNGSGNEFLFQEVTGTDLRSAEILIDIDHEEPSWWVLITHDMVPSDTKERSGIDDEYYVIVSEEHVVDGVANFIAKCILSNPRSMKLTPEELQETVTNALHGVTKLEKMLYIWNAGKLFYTLSTWGLALAGLYQNRGLLKVAAKGVHTTSKFVLKAI